jgi:hypothetical protein
VGVGVLDVLGAAFFVAWAVQATTETVSARIARTAAAICRRVR